MSKLSALLSGNLQLDWISKLARYPANENQISSASLMMGHQH